MPRPKALAELIPPSSPERLFETVPGTMASQGRVEGFEALRDLLLSNWRELSVAYGIPLQALLKLVLETDRHALFAMIAEDKMGDSVSNKNKTQRWFQDFLHGEVETPLHPDMKLSELPGSEREEQNGGE